jgi:hypothetical protein
LQATEKGATVWGTSASVIAMKWKCMGDPFVAKTADTSGVQREMRSLAALLQKLLQDHGAISLLVAGGVDECDRLLLKLLSSGFSILAVMSCKARSSILGGAAWRSCAEYFICMCRKDRRPNEEAHDAMETRLVATATPTEGAPSCR